MPRTLAVLGNTAKQFRNPPDRSCSVWVAVFARGLNGFRRNPFRHASRRARHEPQLTADAYESRSLSGSMTENVRPCSRLSNRTIGVPP